MSSEAKKKSSSPERPHTARSITSNYSFKSDASEDGNQSQMTTDYDRLPAELRPVILHYRRESTTPKVGGKAMTRMEKMQAQMKMTDKDREDHLRRVKRTCVCMYVRMYVCVRTYIYNMYVCVHACMRVCAYICIYVCMHIRF